MVVLVVATSALVILLAEPAEEPGQSFPVGPPAPDPCGEPILRSTGQPWRCTFADDFDGTALDPNRWQVMTTEDFGSPASECRVDEPANVSLRDGVLLLTAIRVPRPFTCESPSGGHLTSGTAGAVTTDGRFAQAYGRVEIVAAMPGYRGVGFHGALWMFPDLLTYGRWPASGEIDIAEYRTGLYGHPVPSLHWLERGEHEILTNYGCTVPAPDQFHSYVLEWNTIGMRFTVDGRTCLMVRFGRAKHPDGRPYDRPFFLILNQSHGTGHNEPDGRTPVSATMRVEAVRVWR